MQEMERLTYRNCFLPLIRAPKESLPPRGVWPRALARVATLPDVIFGVLRSKPSLIPSREKLPPRGFWPRVLARVAALTDVIFEVLRCKPKLVPSEDMEATKDTGVPKKRKRGDES
jgi:hypothetical protein